MSTIKVLAGDFLEGNGSFSSGSFTLRTQTDNVSGETISQSQIETVEIATEESVKRVGGTIGWGVTGAVLLGPVGLLAGLLLGGKGKDVTFIVKFKDGRKLLASSDSSTYTEIQAIAFNHSNKKNVPTDESISTESSTSNEIEKLIKLGDMFDRGLITKDEFTEYKKNLKASTETTTTLSETASIMSENYKRVLTRLSEDYDETTHHISINNQRPIKKELIKNKILQKIENDGYEFLSPITVRQNGTENDFFVKQSDGKVELMSNGKIIKTYIT